MPDHITAVRDSRFKFEMMKQRSMDDLLTAIAASAAILIIEIGKYGVCAAGDTMALIKNFNRREGKSTTVSM